MNYSEKADALRKEMISRIKEMVYVKGENIHQMGKVIDLDSHAFQHPTNLNKTEVRYIGENLMYSKYGNDFAFGDLEIDDLSELTDLLETL